MDISRRIFLFLVLFRVMVFIRGNILFQSPFLGILPGIVIKGILGTSLEVPWILHQAPPPSYCLVMSNSFVTPWTAASQAPLSMRFSKQDYCTGLPFSSPGDLLDPRIEPAAPALAGKFFTTEPPGNPRLRATGEEQYFKTSLWYVLIE